jgi:hypothetical protein
VVKVGVILPSEPEQLSEWLADAAALDAAGADALWVDPADIVLVAALAVLTHRCLIVATVPENETLARLCRGRLRHPDELAWTSVDLPDGRAAWRTTLGEATDEGVLVGADPRLIDLLRNPDGEDDRSDLQLSVG